MFKAKYLTIGFGISTNYTFRNNSKAGYDFELGLFFSPWTYKSEFYIGAKYSVQNIYFQLSTINNKTSQVDNGYIKSQNRIEYFKLPLILIEKLKIGPGEINFLIGLEPLFLIKVNNQHNRLYNSDFKKYNLGWNVGISIPVKKIISFRFSYSKDFFENLKDRNIYNSVGKITGKQKTKTNLISLSILYNISYKLN